MDRSKWEYKKLGEVCEILDKLRKPVTKSDRVAGQYPYYGATGIQDYVANYIFDGRYLLLGEDGAKWGANDRSAFIIEGKTWVNNHAHILKINCDYMDVFLMYYLNHKDLSEYITGAVVPKLTQAAMAKIPVPCINIADQQRIVAELDCLNEMIALKQEQLQEFDKLAQSIFYDMFGDPVSNDKGWDKSLMGDVCDIIAGGDKPNDISTVKTADYCYPVIANGDGEKGILGYSKNRRVEDDSVTIGARGASIGNCRIVYVGYTPVVRLISLTPQKRLNCIYLYYYANQMHYSSTGAGQAQLTVPNVKKAPIPLPPLELQQQFAEKIQAIEAQKELVKKSIAETQQLLDSRMDFYFD